MFGKNIKKLSFFEPPELIVAIQSYVVKPQDDMPRELFVQLFQGFIHFFSYFDITLYPTAMSNV